MRKTVPVTAILEHHDRFTKAIHGTYGLRYSDPEKLIALSLLCSLTESLLYNADAYAGFEWVDKEGYPTYSEDRIYPYPDTSAYYSRRYLKDRRL